MSGTPRTDAAAFVPVTYQGTVVTAETARELERELLAAQAVIALVTETDEWKDWPRLASAIRAYDAAREQP